MTRKAEIETARKVDTEVARLWSLYHEVNDQIAPILKSIKSSKLSALQPYNQSEFRQARIAARISLAETSVAAIREEAEPLKEAAIAYDRENYKGWNRFFLVQHIHNTQHCSSFRPTTRVGWLPNVSGLTEAEAVAEHGATLCTICFPSAPVELTTPKADDSFCEGHAVAPMRTGYYRGNWATCSDCGARATLTSTGKLRKHKK